MHGQFFIELCVRTTKCAPASRLSKLSMPMEMAMERPMADHRE